MKLLIATTNKGKFAEIKSYFGDLGFIECLSLDDIEKEIKAPEESGATIEENAVLKAKYYAKQTGMLSLADDSGLFVHALDGFPGIHSARSGNTVEERNDYLLKKMKELEGNERQACFRAAIAIYHPETGNTFISFGNTEGRIEEEIHKEIKGGFGYDPIFTELKSGRRFSEMKKAEKNACSHRGKALSQAKYYLIKQYSPRQWIVPIGVLVNDKGEILLNKRNDPYNPEFHEKWEFPGGGVDWGESIEENVVREVREESGYEVKVIKRCSLIDLQHRTGKGDLWRVQIFILPHICRVTGGDGVVNDEEVLETNWVLPEKVLDYELVGNNAGMYEKILPEVLEYIGGM